MYLDKVIVITGENICIDGGQTKLMIHHGDHDRTFTPQTKSPGATLAELHRG